MGGRQSQEPDQPSLDSITPPPHRHSSHPLPSHHHLHQRPSSHTRSSPPPLPTLSEYTNLRPVRRPHSHSTGSRPPELPAPHTRTSAEDQFLELNIALSALQRRLQARAEGQDGPHHHHYPLSAGLPLLLFRPPPNVQCPVCSKEFSSSELERHMTQCANRPRVTYNVDTLGQSSGECSICLEDLLQGEEIARLPCLCIYHLKCARQWFKVSQTCPEHPDLV